MDVSVLCMYQLKTKPRPLSVNKKEHLAYQLGSSGQFLCKA